MMEKNIKNIKWLSSLTKVMPTEEPKEEWGNTIPSFLSNEQFSFQCAYYVGGRENNLVTVKTEGALAPYITIRQVTLMPVRYAGRPGCDDNYISVNPGMYPDLLSDVTEGQVRLYSSQWQALFLTVDMCGVNDKEIPLGKQEVTLSFYDKEEDTKEEVCIAKIILTLKVMGEKLPSQKLFHTEWFHADCLANYYKVEVFSEEHWTILENYITHYVKMGMNTILVPTFTPALDTAVGHQRTTVQLVDVIEEEGIYQFGFDRLYRFICLCKNSGITHFEIAHLFTQWGAKAAPKVMGIKEGKLQQLFGWETDSKSEEYLTFLKAYLKALTAKLEEWGLKDTVFFHLSDEPDENNRKDYSYLKSALIEDLEGYKVLDAVSRYSFYEEKIVEMPVPGIDHLEPFLKNKVPHLWTYYCNAQEKKVSNRFFSMPSARTRILGVLLYYHGIEGFLHWGFNFYNTQYSLKQINPYEVTDAGGAFPSGDAFLVYPGEDGHPKDSLRMIAMSEAMQDIRALELLEARTSREHVIHLIEECAGGRITMEDYPVGNDFLLTLRDKVNSSL